MNNVFEKLFGIHIDDEPMTPNELNDVETLSAADYDGATYIPVIYGTDDNPLAVTMPGAVRTIDTPSTSWSATRVTATQGTVTQLANANPFRIRLTIIPAAGNAMAIGPNKELLTSGISLPIISDAGGSLPIPLNTKAEVWAVNNSAGLDVVVIQEFLDGSNI